MNRLAVVAALLLAVSSDSLGGEVPVEPPVRVVRQFLVSVKSHDCERAWSFLSAASRAYIACKSKEMTASAPYNADSFSAHNLYCLPTAAHRYNSYQSDTARLQTLSGSRAIVIVEVREPAGFLLPGFLPTRHRSAPVEMTLIKEQGRWTIQVQTSTTGPRSHCTLAPS